MRWEAGASQQYLLLRNNESWKKSVVFERKVKIMEEEGIIFVTGVDVGKDKKVKELLQEFDGVVLACGSSNP